MKHYLPNSLRALFLSLAVLLSLPMLAVEVEIDGINYDLNAEAKQATVIKKSSGKYSGEVVIPESVEHEGAAYRVTSIGDAAFFNWPGLTSVTIPNSVTSIGHSAFAYCSGLTSVTIPNSVTSIGRGAFDYCLGLSSVTIGNSVTSIGREAFHDCSGLISVTIGSGVESIGWSAFSDCSKLLDVYCYAEKVPSTESTAFNYSPIVNATLHVPAASIDSYKATAPWRRFGKIVALTEEETGIDELKGENGKVKTALYDLSGRRVQKGQKGVFIQNGKVMVR
ncbi:MAG: leucine-rich repeat domain-containing protein [Bacteroidaceae bacterium]|nr:leucine-rich repeat domain-containing protein [Bacteroidaceae bacterium]